MRRTLGAALAAIVSLSLPALAVEDEPHVGYVFPAGLRAGTTVTVLLGGQNLETITNVHLDDPSVKWKFVSFTKNLERQTLNNMQNRKENLEGKLSNATEAERPNLERQLQRLIQQMAQAEPPPSDPDMMKFMNMIKPRRQINNQLTDLVRLELTVPEGAEPGRREIRLETARGVSEPLAWFVGRLPESVEKEPNDERRISNVEALPAVLNGQVLPGDVDNFRIRFKKGQTLVFSAQIRQVMPYLADAVPGFFQSLMALYSEDGRKVAQAEPVAGRLDPFLVYTAPADGDYFLEVRDAIYRGREDFVYRITAGELPFVTSIFPLGGNRETATRVALTGVNLPSREIPFNPKLGEVGVVPWQPIADAASPEFLFHAEEVAEIAESATPHGFRSNAQEIDWPCVINGRLLKAGEVDAYRFQAKAGDRITAEIFARRLGSPVDTFLRLVDSEGRTIATNDDRFDPQAGLVTHHADSAFDATIPADGAYFLSVRDTLGKGGADRAYRLKVSPATSEFSMMLTPSSLSVPRGGIVAFDVHVKRGAAFQGDITLSLVDAPKGCRLSGAVIPAGGNRVPVTLVVPDNLPKDVFSLKVIGTAKAPDGSAIRREAKPSEEMMQAFFNLHLVPTGSLPVKLVGRARMNLSLDVPAGESAKLSASVTNEIEFRLTPAQRKGIGDQNLTIDLENAVKGIAVLKTEAPDDKGVGRILVQITPSLVKPGQKGNLVFNGYLMVNEKKKNPDSKRNFLCTLPAVPYEIVP